MIRDGMNYKIAFLAGLIEGDRNLYAYSNSCRRYVRIYTPDLSEVIWIIKASKEIFDKLPIVGLDRPRSNKKLYIFRLEFHNSFIYNLFKTIDITNMSKFELLGYLSGLVYAEGHIKFRKKKDKILFDSLEIEMRKKSSIDSLIEVCQLLGIRLKSYNRLKRKHKVYYIRDHHLTEEIMSIVHLNWKWTKLLASLNKIDFCTYVLTKLYDHIVLNHIIGKFFSKQSLSYKETMILRKIVSTESISGIRTRASILYISSINSVDGIVDMIKSLPHRNYVAEYIHYLRDSDLSFYKHCLDKT